MEVVKMFFIGLYGIADDEPYATLLFKFLKPAPAYHSKHELKKVGS